MSEDFETTGFAWRVPITKNDRVSAQPNEVQLLDAMHYAQGSVAEGGGSFKCPDVSLAAVDIHGQLALNSAPWTGLSDSRYAVEHMPAGVSPSLALYPSAHDATNSISEPSSLRPMPAQDTFVNFAPRQQQVRNVAGSHTQCSQMMLERPVSHGFLSDDPLRRQLSSELLPPELGSQNMEFRRSPRKRSPDQSNGEEPGHASYAEVSELMNAFKIREEQLEAALASAEAFASAEQKAKDARVAEAVAQIQFYYEEVAAELESKARHVKERQDALSEHEAALARLDCERRERQRQKELSQLFEDKIRQEALEKRHLQREKLTATAEIWKNLKQEIAALRITEQTEGHATRSPSKPRLSQLPLWVIKADEDLHRGEDAMRELSLLHDVPLSTHTSLYMHHPSSRMDVTSFGSTFQRPDVVWSAEETQTVFNMQHFDKMGLTMASGSFLKEEPHEWNVIQEFLHGAQEEERRGSPAHRVFDRPGDAPVHVDIDALQNSSLGRSCF